METNENTFQTHLQNIKNELEQLEDLFRKEQNQLILRSREGDIEGKMVQGKTRRFVSRKKRGGGRKTQRKRKQKRRC
jgi:hypothetical protein